MLFTFIIIYCMYVCVYVYRYSRRDWVRWKSLLIHIVLFFFCSFFHRQSNRWGSSPARYLPTLLSTFVTLLWRKLPVDRIIDLVTDYGFRSFVTQMTNGRLVKLGSNFTLHRETGSFSSCSFFFF